MGMASWRFSWCLKSITNIIIIVIIIIQNPLFRIGKIPFGIGVIRIKLSLLTIISIFSRVCIIPIISALVLVFII